MTVEEVIAQVRRRIYDQVTVTADAGEGSEVALGLGGSWESGFVVRYGREAAAAMTASTVTSGEHDDTGNDNVSNNGWSSSGGSNSDGVVIESSDVSTWTASQQDYTELVYLCKYATTTQPPPPALMSSSDSTSSGGGGGSTAGDSSGVGGGLLQSSSSVHVPQLALLVMNEPNPETAGDRLTD